MAYSTFRVGIDGKPNEVVEWSEFGQDVSLSPVEEIRLDLLSASH
jgi:hypothetical protein